MTLNGRYAFCCRKDACFGAHHKKLNEDRPILSAAKCRPLTLGSGDVKCVRIFAGVLWRGASDDSGVIENVNFHGFWTLRLRQLRKWGLHYYTVLFSPQLPFQWPQNIRPWMTLTENNCVKTDKDRHILSAVQILGMDSSFWWYKVCADIRSGSLERRR